VVPLHCDLSPFTRDSARTLTRYRGTTAKLSFRYRGITAVSVTAVLSLTSYSINLVFVKELQDFMPLKRGRIVSRSAIPAIPRSQQNATVFDKELDTFQMTLGRSQVEGSSTIIVRHGHVLLRKCHPPQCRQIAVVRGKQQINDLAALNLGIAQSRIALLRSALPVFVVMEVEPVHQFLAELKYTIRIFSTSKIFAAKENRINNIIMTNGKTSTIFFHLTSNQLAS